MQRHHTGGDRDRQQEGAEGDARCRQAQHQGADDLGELEPRVQAPRFGIAVMEPGELRVVEGNGAAWIVRLDETLPPADTDELRQLRDALSSQMDQALAQNIFNAYVRDAQTRARPVVDQQALNAVQASF